jgi:threonine dehydrogenase-like Zn-dependent dehydrogenase
MITPHGCGWGHLPRDYPGWTKHRAYDAIVSLMKSKGLDVGEIINAEITIEQGAEIYKQIKNNPENIVKYVVRFRRLT